MSKEDDLPSWLNEDLPSASAKSVPKSAPVQQQQQQPQRAQTQESLGAAPLPISMRGKREMVYWGMKGITLTLCCLMAFTSVMGVMSVNGIDDTGRIMVAIYMIILSTLLAGFEIIQIKACDALDRIYRRNFGFLYGTKGKSFFIIL